MGVFKPQLSIPDTTDDDALQVAALEDLMATKLKVMLQRIESKDYEDIAAMIEAGQSLERGLAIARAMFGNDFQPNESLKALTWLEGGDLSRLGAETKRLLIETASAVRRLPSVTRTAQTLALPHP
ncbi:MAG TPA: nucleotidyl transferase AbiEii/AbiGii toxin family protein [Gammaproteobacteria bacterium]|nr:nucleotidyl transferase AbiEii/AbiGii toxin family protein [Gammaproteobacteria bacterium]